MLTALRACRKGRLRREIKNSILKMLSLRYTADSQWEISSRQLEYRVWDTDTKSLSQSRQLKPLVEVISSRGSLQSGKSRPLGN